MTAAKPVVASVVVLLAGAAIVGFVFSRRPSARERALADDLAAMQAEVAALRRDTSRLATAPLALAAVTAPGPKGAPATPERPAAPANLAALPGPTALEIERHVGAVFSAEGTDAIWSQPAIQKLSEEIGKRLPQGAALQSVDCRKTLCRVRATHADIETYHKFMEDTLASRENGLWNAAISSLIVEQTAGAVRTVTYIAREGANIPEVPAP
jgi:hypothetical protein